MLLSDTEVKASSILIVEDEPSVAYLLDFFLRRAGYSRIEIAADAPAALRACAEAEPDLVLLDLHLGATSGLDLLADLRERIAPDAFLPIVVVTGDLRTEQRLRALAGGATDFLTKPFDEIELLLRVRNLLAGRMLYRRLASRDAV